MKLIIININDADDHNQTSWFWFRSLFTSLSIVSKCICCYNVLCRVCVCMCVEQVKICGNNVCAINWWRWVRGWSSAAAAARECITARHSLSLCGWWLKRDQHCLGGGDVARSPLLQPHHPLLFFSPSPSVVSAHLWLLWTIIIN